MEKQQDTIGYLGLTIAGVGAIASVVTQNIAFASLPLTVGVGCNLFSRKQHHDALLEVLNTQQVTIEQLQEKLEENKIAISEQLQEKLVENRREAGNLIEGVKSSLADNLEEQKQDLTKELKRLDMQYQELNKQVATLEQVENLSQNIGIEENSALFFYERGLGYEKLGNQEGAIKDYTQAIKEDSTLAKAYHKRGVIYMAQSQKQKAVDDLRKAALLYFEQGDIESYHQAREMSRNIHDLRSYANVNSSESKSTSTKEMIAANDLFA